MSNRLTIVECEDVTEGIQKILQRPRGQWRHPMSDADQVKLWEHFLPPKTVESYYTLKADGYEMHGLTNSTRKITVRFNTNHSLHLHLWLSAAIIWKGGNYGAVIEPLLLEKILGSDKAERLTRWMNEITRHEDRAKQALSTLEAVLELPNTLGQLSRMVPEIVPFLSHSAQKKIQQQEKSSALPHKWAAFDKDMVHAMMDQICMCALLPQVEYNSSAHGPLGFSGNEVRVERAK